MIGPSEPVTGRRVVATDAAAKRANPAGKHARAAAPRIDLADAVRAIEVAAVTGDMEAVKNNQSRIGS